MKKIVSFTLLLFIAISGISQEKDWKLFPKENEAETQQEPLTVPIYKQEPKHTKGTELAIAKDTIFAPRDTSKVTPGTVEIIQDLRIEKLMNKYAGMCSDDATVNGYRIQLFSGSGAGSKAKAAEVQGDFLKKHNDQTCDLVWQQPNFLVRVGGFRTKIEAIGYHKSITNDFPYSFVVRDQIELPKLQASTSKQ